MMAKSEEFDEFLESISHLEEKIVKLILKSDLTLVEKQFILDHILIIPGKRGDHEESKAI
ncbi:hypothetical protein HQN90_00260 [Paenibacillus alba]|uniref:hypothetical protein n=1 Tax=Paenibacillus alba TaxID=1197127 RepID=UPI00156488E5|nr:hypothetical protein [Paenibacillus alba]NQX64547.1 hypothetical protein [Paenibacillus alba]